MRLVYAKADAIQGFVQQEFAEYQTKVLGNPKGNNKNFRFTINGKGAPDETVVRVEDRNSVGKEQVLQAHPVIERNRFTSRTVYAEVGRIIPNEPIKFF